MTFRAGPAVTLVRHPKPLVPGGVCYGRLDVGLHPDGIAAVADIVARIAAENPDAELWTSPALRCRMVANASARPARVDARLQELDFGCWEGVSWDSVARADLDRWAADPKNFAPPGGESGAALIARVQDFAADLISGSADSAPSRSWSATADHPRLGGGDAIVISHGGPLKVLRAILLGQMIDLLGPPPALGSVETIILPTLTAEPTEN